MLTTMRTGPLGGVGKKEGKRERSSGAKRAHLVYFLPVLGALSGLGVCSGRDSNPHSLRNQILNLARLPISPPERKVKTLTACMALCQPGESFWKSFLAVAGAGVLT